MDHSQGASLDRYVIVPRTLIFITCGEAVLLLKGAPHKRLWANHYNGIGGHVEPGEDVLSAARRELLEEAGLQAPDLRLVGTLLIDTGGNPGVGLYIFHGELPTQVIPQASVEGELDWVSFEQLDQLPVMQDLPALLERVLATRPGDPPFAGLRCSGEGGEWGTQFA